VPPKPPHEIGVEYKLSIKSHRRILTYPVNGFIFLVNILELNSMYFALSNLAAISDRPFQTGFSNIALYLTTMPGLHSPPDAKCMNASNNFSGQEGFGAKGDRELLPEARPIKLKGGRRSHCRYNLSLIYVEHLQGYFRQRVFSLLLYPSPLLFNCCPFEGRL